MLITAICLIIVAVLFSWHHLSMHFSYWEKRKIMHTKPSIPTGNMYEWMRTKHSCQIYAETYNNFKGSGPYVGFYLNMQRAVLVLDVELTKKILIKDFKHFERRGFFHNEKDDPLTGNLFLLDGEKWKLLKPKVSHLFTVAKIKYMYPTLLRVGAELQKVFAERVRASGNGIMDVHYIMARYTADMIASCAFGVVSNSLRDPKNKFYKMARYFFSKPRHFVVDSLMHCFPEWAKKLHMQAIPKDVTDYFINIFKEKFTQRERDNVKKSDFVDLLINLQNQQDRDQTLTMEELTAQSFMFFIAGFDTCSTTISYALHELALNPDVQNRLRREITEILAANKQKLSYAALKDMKYLDQVISETLRKYPVAPALFRKCTEDYKTDNEHYYIEKGCTVIIPTLSYHFDGDLFSNPGRFDPDRFAPANIGNIKPCSYLPFGDGQRSCIGMRFARVHVGIALAKLVKAFQFSICEKTKVPVEIVVPSFNLNTVDITLKVTKV